MYLSLMFVTNCSGYTLVYIFISIEYCTVLKIAPVRTHLRIHCDSNRKNEFLKCYTHMYNNIVCCNRKGTELMISIKLLSKYIILYLYTFKIQIDLFTTVHRTSLQAYEFKLPTVVLVTCRSLFVTYTRPCLLVYECVQRTTAHAYIAVARVFIYHERDNVSSVRRIINFRLQSLKKSSRPRSLFGKQTVQSNPKRVIGMVNN